MKNAILKSKKNIYLFPSDKQQINNPNRYINFIDYKITKIKNIKVEDDDWDFPEEEIPPHKLKQKLEENEMAKK